MEIIFLERKNKTEAKDNVKPKLVANRKGGKHLINVKEILKSTNATPIGRYHVIGFSCCYCKEKFKLTNELKKHTLMKHKDVTRASFMNKSLREFNVKLDITSLACKLCRSSIDSIGQAIEHLKEIHAKNMTVDIEDHIIPFKFDSDKFKCCICLAEFGKYKPLLLHMNVHYRNYECSICGAGFINAHMLNSHKHIHGSGEFECEKCHKVFNSNQKRKAHEKSHTDANFHKCPYCVERFCNSKYKDGHMAKVHGVPLATYNCKACDKTFTDSTRYNTHLKRDHLLEKPYKCELCSKEFFVPRLLRDHMISHSGERKFQCEVCLKSYGMKRTLREHMRIHNNDRRFTCDHCEQSFVQKCSWRSHMRNKHGYLNISS